MSALAELLSIQVDMGEAEQMACCDVLESYCGCSYARVIHVIGEAGCATGPQVCVKNADQIIAIAYTPSRRTPV